GVVLYLVLRGPALVPASPAPSVAVSTMHLALATLPRTVTAYGGITTEGGAREIDLPASGIITGVEVLAGQSVTAGQVLADIAADAQSVADLRKAQDALAAAQAARARTAGLLSSHLATNADLAAADQAMRDASANLKALRVNGAGGTRAINAPCAGVVIAVLAAPGAAQSAGAPLFKLACGVAAIAGVPEDVAATIAPGDAATLTLLNASGSISAKVTQIAAMLDPQTGLIDVTLSPNDPAALGEPVKAVITAGGMTGYAVPRNAVQNDEAGDYVFQLDAAGIAHRVSVHVLGSAGDNIVLAPGLNTALPLVTSGAYGLDDGAATRNAGQGN
ncbi:MAG: efflux RND transporter periplasmic adaptor subunit, partial [Acidocella sp.]|nr:efflux RND transporter periplasmic adaptor subunit [Acidocella sp.]